MNTTPAYQAAAILVKVTAYAFLVNAVLLTAANQAAPILVK